jgi:hypothetical protein
MISFLQNSPNPSLRHDLRERALCFPWTTSLRLRAQLSSEPFGPETSTRKRVTSNLDGVGHELRCGVLFASFSRPTSPAKSNIDTLSGSEKLTPSPPRRKADVMPRIFMIGALLGFLAASVQAETLDISIAAQGAAYSSMVRDAKLRGDGGGGIEDANLGAGTGASSINRIYANFLLDGTTPSGRLNTFVQWFDVSSIPAGSIISSAILTEYFSNQTANGRTFVICIFRSCNPAKIGRKG